MADPREADLLDPNRFAALARRRARPAVALAAGAALAFPALSASAPTTSRASLGPSGAQANRAAASAALSGTGRFVVFHSSASNLVARDRNGRVDVFLRDRETRTTRRLSVSPRGGGGNGHSTSPAISEDGRFVAFDSSASNLVARDGNRKVDVFVRDRQTGTTRRVSVTSSGAGANGPSFDPSISADGRIVGFDSGASNLVRRDRNDAWDVFVRDRQAGTTRRVSVSSAGVAGNRDSWSAVVSPDGRHVAFASLAFNLVGGDTNRQADVFVRDRQTGTTTRVSVRSNGRQANGGSAFPAISANGRFVAFRSVATNLVAGDTNGHADVFVHDRETGRTRRISVARDGSQANGPSDAPALSADGNLVAFESSATNLIPSDTNAYRDVFVRDRAAGRTRRVSISTSYVAGNGLSERATLSGDGRVVAFTSYATNLVRRDTNRRADVFVRGPFPWASTAGRRRLR